MSDPKLRRKLKGRFAEKEDKPKYMPGLLGNGQGVVNTGTDGIVYVRVNEMATTAVCTTLPPVNDLPVWVYKPAFDKARLHVHSQRFYSGSDEQIISGASQHAETHRYFGSGAKGGSDVLYVDPRQIIGIRIFPIENTMTCAVFPWVVLIDGVPKLIGTLEEDGTYTPETLDFSPYLITTEDKSKIMLITLDNTGALVITEGAEVDTDAINIETDTPAVPAGTKIVIGAVRLYYGQYAIQEGRENTDLMDWRWLYYHVHEGGSGELDIGIDGLNDVTISTIGDLNVLQYDSAGGAWVNKTLAEAGINPMTTAGDIIYGGADGAVTRLAIGAVTQVLTVSAGGTAPEWATAAEGFVNPMTTIGDFIYGGTDGEATRLAIGGALEVLRINAAGTGPEWYLSTSFENPMTTIGDIVYGTTDGAVTRLAAGTEAQILAVIGGIPGWTDAGTDIGFSNPMTTIGDIIYGGTDGEAVRLAAGTEAQILAVASGVPAWTNAPGGGDMNNPMTTIGDIIYATTDGTPARLGIGDNDDVLTLASGVPTWASPGAGGGDSTYTAAYASRPAASNDGDLFFPNNSFYIERDTGAAWVPWGPIYPLTAPIPGDFTWVNQESATLTTTPGGMSIYAPASSGNDWRILKKAAPSTPYTITILISLMAYPSVYMSAGLIFMQSSDGKFVTNNALSYDGNSNVAKYTNYNTYSAGYATWGTLYRSHLTWLRITDNGTNRISSYSLDGYNFIQKHTVGRTDFITADEVGIGINASQTYDAVLNLLSWKET